MGTWVCPFTNPGKLIIFCGRWFVRRCILLRFRCGERRQLSITFDGYGTIINDCAGAVHCYNRAAGDYGIYFFLFWRLGIG